MKRLITVFPALLAATIALQGCASGGAAGQARQTGPGSAADRAAVTVTVTSTSTVTLPGTGTGGPGSTSTGPTGTGPGPTGTGGPGSTSTGPTGTPSSEPPCTDVTYADPWIAFEPALADRDVLTVGKRGWLSTSRPLSDISVQGSAGAVQLSEQSAPTVIRCGRATSTVRWIEVAAKAPGSVTLVIADGTAAAKTMHITIVEA